MATDLATSTNPAVRASRAVLDRLLAGHGPRNFAVRFWDVETWPADPGQPTRFTLVLNHPAALRAMLLPASRLSVGEAYIFGDYDVEGDLEALFDLFTFWADRRRGLWEKLALFRLLRRLPAERRPRDRLLGTASLSGDVHSPQRD